MNFRPSSLRAALLALVVATTASTGLALATSATAVDATTPPWQTGAGVDPDRAGTLAFYDADGNQVFSGKTTDPFPFAVASTANRAGDDHATLYASTPKVDTAQGDWSSTQLTAASAYPVTGAPSTVSSTLPVSKGTADDNTLEGHIASFANLSSAAGYQNVYELRLLTSKAGADPVSTTSYAVADLLVNPTAHTWTVLYGSPVAKRTASVSTPVVSTAKPVYGKAFTVTATASVAAGAKPTGNATLLEGTKVLYTKALSDGVARFTVAGTKLAAGSHKLSVKYLGSATVAAKTSAVRTVVVAKATSKTTNKLDVSSIKSTKTAKLTIKVAATGVTSPTGSIKVYDGTKVIKTLTLTAVKKGTYVYTLPKLKVGTHKLHAVYAGSTSVATSTAATVTLKSTK